MHEGRLWKRTMTKEVVLEFCYARTLIPLKRQETWLAGKSAPNSLWQIWLCQLTSSNSGTVLPSYVSCRLSVIRNLLRQNSQTIPLVIVRFHKLPFVCSVFNWIILSYLVLKSHIFRPFYIWKRKNWNSGYLVENNTLNLGKYFGKMWKIRISFGNS